MVPPLAVAIDLSASIQKEYLYKRAVFYQPILSVVRALSQMLDVFWHNGSMIFMTENVKRLAGKAIGLRLKM